MVVNVVLLSTKGCWQTSSQWHFSTNP